MKYLISVLVPTFNDYEGFLNVLNLYSRDRRVKMIVSDDSSNALINTTENPILMNGDVIHVNKTLLGNVTEVIGEFTSPILSGIGLYEIFN